MAKRFEEVTPPLSEEVLSVVRSLGFSTMTPVQSAVIPLFLGNKDISAEACTGSGKTLAFVIPLIERLSQLATPLLRHQVGAVIISPTRELARQIFGVVKLFTDAIEKLHPILLVGGTEVATDLLKCVSEGCNIVVATPGRLLDVLNRSAHNPDGVDFKKVEVLVMDEADTLLDMGFSDAITEILGKLPKQRRTGLFSATQTTEVAALARAGLRNPAVVSVKIQFSSKAASKDAAAGGAGVVQTTPATLQNFVTICEDSVGKFIELIRFLQQRAEANEKAIVFVLTCASVDYYAKVLDLPAVRKAAGLPPDKRFPVLPLHGQMAPTKRTSNYATFMGASTGVLLCTDVAARGIDVPDVDWILQYDPPKDPAFYVHRVGRTARAGKKGSAKLLLLPKESAFIELLGVKNVPVRDSAPLNSDGKFTTERIDAVMHTLKHEATLDREVLEKSTKAFISFLRGYSEHVCRYIFKPKHLDIPSLAASYGLVKLPKVDELRGQDIPYVGLPDVDTSKIAYKDAKREEQRQRKLAEDAEKLAAERAARDARREKAIAAAASTTQQKRKRTHKGVQKKMFEDWEILQREERLEKRLKQGKITKQEYKREMALIHKDMGIEDDDGLADLVEETAAPAAKRPRKASSDSDDHDNDDDDSGVDDDDDESSDLSD